MNRRGEGRAHPYPTDQVVAVLDDAEVVDAAAQDLREAGFDADDLDVLCGQSGIEQMDRSGKRHGLLDRIIRVAEYFGPEQEHMRRLEQEFADGHFGVGVKVADDKQKQQVADLLQSHGGHYIHYYGRNTVEELAP